MWKLRGAVLAATGLCALVPAGTALASSGGDSNAGDVWVDTVSAPAGPGHEMDPHLPCANINLWGNGLADSTGTFTIDGWPPSGNKAQDYSDTWNYSQDPSRKSGDQVIAVIDVTTLIDNAAANGEAPVNKQGYHFKLALSQDPQKYKTFWVNCPAPTPSSTGGGTSGGGSTTTPTGPTTGTTGVTKSTSATKKSHRRRTRRRRHALKRPHRAHRVKHRHIASVKNTTAEFTG
jgi:hypothetical protein